MYLVVAPTYFFYKFRLVQIKKNYLSMDKNGQKNYDHPRGGLLGLFYIQKG